MKRLFPSEQLSNEYKRRDIYIIYISIDISLEISFFLLYKDIFNKYLWDLIKIKKWELKAMACSFCEGYNSRTFFRKHVGGAQAVPEQYHVLYNLEGNSQKSTKGATLDASITREVVPFNKIYPGFKKTAYRRS
jgi:hypothetical protein